MREIVIEKNEAGQRLDKFLAKYMNEASKSFFYKMMRKKNITLNGKKCEGNEKLAEGDVVKLFLAEDTIEKFSSVQVQEVKKVDLDILYEDDEIILVNKPAGMLSQKAKETDESLVEYLIDYLLGGGKLTESGLSSSGSMMMIACFAVGALLGEWIDLDTKMERFGEWLKEKTKSDGDNAFVDAFVTASLTVCIGAMAVVGSIRDGIYGDYSILTAKAVLDMIIVAIMTASMGKGCIFSAIPVGMFQGAMTLLAKVIEPFLTDEGLADMSLTGSVLIFCVGVNLIWGKKIKVANLLPVMFLAAVWPYFPWA